MEKSKELTPLQEFKKWFKAEGRNALNNDISKKITELIQQEKQGMINTFEEGEHHQFIKSQNKELKYQNSVDYYNKKYN